MFGLHLEKSGEANVLWSTYGSAVRVDPKRTPQKCGAVGLAWVRRSYAAALRRWELEAWKLPCGAQDRFGYLLEVLREDYCLLGAGYELLRADEDRIYAELRGEDDLDSCFGSVAV